MTLKSYARICLIATVVFCLNGCAGDSDKPAPAIAPTPDSATTEPDAAPVPPPATPPKTPSAVPAAPQGTAKRDTTAVKPPTPAPPATKSAAAPSPAVTLDLMALEEQLKSTKAIGLFSKIALKNKVDDLMKDFRDHYKGKTSPTMAELHQSYDLLIMKVLSMVQDDDQTLASAIVSSRESIWNLLADPKKFATLDV